MLLCCVMESAHTPLNLGNGMTVKLVINGIGLLKVRLFKLSVRLSRRVKLIYQLSKLIQLDR